MPEYRDIWPWLSVPRYPASGSDRCDICCDQDPTEVQVWPTVPRVWVLLCKDCAPKCPHCGGVASSQPGGWDHQTVTHYSCLAAHEAQEKADSRYAAQGHGPEYREGVEYAQHR